ncbi:hypothetical protein JCM10207_003190 [Rhodosporidiobolus poonsookiae]
MDPSTSSSRASSDAADLITRLAQELEEAITLEAPEEQPTVVRRLGRKIKNPRLLRLYDMQGYVDRIASLLGASDRAMAPVAGPSSSSLSPEPVRTSSVSPLDAADDGAILQLAESLRPLALASPAGPPAPSADRPRPHSPPSLDMYQHHLDADTVLDPVNLGLLSEADLVRLLSLFVNNMQHYHYFLHPHLHTTHFIRHVSPFLTTVVALTAAPYCPLSLALIPGLQKHADYLSTRIFAQNFKSMEILLAYSIWAPWSSASATTPDDRTWLHINQATRLVSELRLDKPLAPELVEQYFALLHSAPGLAWYRAVMPLPLLSDLLDEVRLRAQQLPFTIQLALGISTGRTAPHYSTGCIPTRSRTATPSDSSKQADRAGGQGVAEGHEAAVTLRDYMAVALDNYTRSQNSAESISATQFNATWRPFFSQWAQQFRDCDWHLFLLGLSLRFGGTRDEVISIIEECRNVSVQACRHVAGWLEMGQKSLMATNSTIIYIAYLARFMIMSHAFIPHGSPRPTEVNVVELARPAVQLLQAIGAARLDGKSLATAYAVSLEQQLRSFAPADAPPPAPAIPSQPHPPEDNPLVYDPLLAAAVDESTASSSFLNLAQDDFWLDLFDPSLPLDLGPSAAVPDLGWMYGVGPASASADASAGAQPQGPL